MRIAIDTSALSLNAAGTSTYIRQLTAALRRDHRDIGLVCLSYTPRFRRSHRLLRILDTIVREYHWTTARLPHLAITAHADVLHAPAAITPCRAQIPIVVTIYDVYPLRNPKAFTVWQQKSLPRYLTRAVQCAERVIAISEFTKSEILSYFPDLDPSRVTITPLAADDGFAPATSSARAAVRAKYGITGPFVLGVCTIEPRKNLGRLLNAFAVATSGLEHSLVLAGPAGWKSGDIPSRLRELGLASRVRMPGFVDGDDLPALYSEADAFVYPSLYEGFGLPPLEAMACGCPVITSNVTALPEVVGTAAELVNPLQIEDIASAMRRVLTNHILRESLRERGLARSKLFSWSRCAQQTVSVYRSVLGGRNGTSHKSVS